MKAIPRIVYGLLGFVLLGLLAWGLLAWRDHELRKDFALKLTGDSLRTEEKAKQAALRERDSAFAINLQQRIVYRDRVLAGNSPTIPRPEVERIVRECRETEADCAAQRKAAQELIDNLRGQVTNLTQIKKRQPPRFAPYVMAGYDIVSSEVLAQGGADFRLVGPFSIAGFIQASKGQQSEPVETRGVAAIRFTFR